MKTFLTTFLTFSFLVAIGQNLTGNWDYEIKEYQFKLAFINEDQIIADANGLALPIKKLRFAKTEGDCECAISFHKTRGDIAIFCRLMKLHFRSATPLEIQSVSKYQDQWAVSDKAFDYRYFVLKSNLK